MKKEDYRLQITDYRFLFLLFSVLCSPFSVGYAKEITILYTGETHAMLHPCSCPLEPDGGIARRATLIKQLRKNNPHTLLLDAGAFFAGGAMDEYTQNTELDRARALVNLKAMELMRYDAAAVGDDEFNFSREFLEEKIVGSKIAFLSCNTKSEKFLPYLIKEAAGAKVGIIGVTPLRAMPKAEGLKFIEPEAAVKNAVAELKKNGVNLIVLLSRLGESDDLKLIRAVNGIDILITGRPRDKEEPPQKIGATIILRPSWQGKRLGKISLSLTDNYKIANYKIEELRLSEKITDDLEMLSLLPACFSDAQCKKKGFVGACLGPGTLNARCQFSQPPKINLTIITPKVCQACDSKAMAGYLEKQFPGLSISYLYYPGSKADRLIKEFGLTVLPAYILGEEIEKETNFDNLSKNLEKKGDFYIVKKEFSGFAYFLNRKEIKGRIDLFISLFEKNSADLLNAIKDFNPTVHFLAVEQKDGFEAVGGNAEVEENLRAVCVEKYYPQYFWDYLTCRMQDIHSSWWEDCTEDFNSEKIKTCARGPEGKALLRENIILNKEIQAMFGPTYLLDNQVIFGTEGVPTKEELKKIFRK